MSIVQKFLHAAFGTFSLWRSWLFGPSRETQRPKARSVEERVRGVIEKSDIVYDSDPDREIAGELANIGLNLAFFVFETAEHSSCARTNDGDTKTYPVLTIYLKYNTDFYQTGIDSHRGNWDDTWAQTRTVRSAANAVLSRHGFDENYVSDRTYIFVRTLEELVFREIGRESKQAVQQFVCNEVRGAVVSRVFWNGQQFDVIMENKADYKRVRRSLTAKASKELPKILAAADIDGHCQDYNASIRFGYSGMNMFHPIEEDVQ